MASARVARLATCGADGRPHAVPIAFAFRDGVLYSAVDAKPKRSEDLKRLRNIEARPEVCVLVDHYSEDWSRLWWCRLEGTARVVRQGAERERGLALLGEKYPQYREEPPPGPVSVVEVRRATGWAASG